MFCLVDLEFNTLVLQRDSIKKVFNLLDRVVLPNGVIVFSPPVNYVYTIENPKYKIYPVSVIDQGTGPVIKSISEPVFDTVTNSVSVTRILEAAPLAPAPDELADKEFGLLAPNTRKALIDKVFRMTNQILTITVSPLKTRDDIVTELKEDFKRHLTA